MYPHIPIVRALVQAAVSLANELDVFNEFSDSVINNAEETGATAAFTLFRRRRLRMLLYVYVNQMATRIGCSSLVPNVLSAKSPNPVSTGLLTGPEKEWFDMISLYVDLTRLIRASSDLLFPSKAITRDLVLNGGYSRILEHFKPTLETWWNKYATLTGKLLPNASS